MLCKENSGDVFEFDFERLFQSQNFIHVTVNTNTDNNTKVSLRSSRHRRRHYFVRLNFPGQPRGAALFWRQTSPVGRQEGPAPYDDIHTQVQHPADIGEGCHKVVHDLGHLSHQDPHPVHRHGPPLDEEGDDEERHRSRRSERKETDNFYIDFWSKYVYL